MPFFSIIIPTYNSGDFLSKTLSCVKCQTFIDWECIIIDNNSTDNTACLIENIIDKRFRVINIQNFGVIAKSRNIGFSNAQGDWIAFLDSDDHWYPERLEILFKQIKKYPKHEVFSTDEYVINTINGSKSVNTYGPYDENFYEKLLIYGNRLSTSATVVNRQFLIEKKLKFSEENKYITVEDYELWLRIAAANGRFKFIPMICGEYIIHGKNNSAKIFLHHSNLKIMLLDHLDNFNHLSKNKRKIRNEILTRVHLIESRALIGSGSFFSGIFKIVNLFLIRPLITIKFILIALKKYFNLK